MTRLQQTRKLAQAFKRYDRALAELENARRDLDDAFFPWAARRSINRDIAREQLVSTGYLPESKVYSHDDTNNNDRAASAPCPGPDTRQALRSRHTFSGRKGDRARSGRDPAASVQEGAAGQPAADQPDSGRNQLRAGRLRVAVPV